MEKAEVRSRLEALEATYGKIDWAKLIAAILALIDAFKPIPTPVPPVPGPVVVSAAADAVELLAAEVEKGKIDWAKLLAFIEKILPLILPFFV